MEIMRKQVLIVGIVFIGVLALGLSFPAGTRPRPAERTDCVPGQVLLKFKPSAMLFQKAAALSLTRSRAVSRIVKLDVYTVQIPDDMTVDEMVGIFGRNPDIEFAQPNYIYRAAVTPNDLYFQYQ
jgi:thermitase